MKLSIGSDHAGYDLKKQIFEYLQKEGHVVIDQGTYNKDSVDYPDFAGWVVKDVQNKDADGHPVQQQEQGRCLLKSQRYDTDDNGQHHKKIIYAAERTAVIIGFNDPE